MKAEKIESSKYPLSGGYYILRRVGQDRPENGDDVIVNAIILLPSDNTWLNKDICFGQRCYVGGNGLHSGWGYPYTANPKYRYITLYFSSKTWAKAFDLAAKRADEELNKLETALADRAKALADAELE